MWCKIFRNNFKAWLITLINLWSAHFFVLFFFNKRTKIKEIHWLKYILVSYILLKILRSIILFSSNNFSSTDSTSSGPVALFVFKVLRFLLLFQFPFVIGRNNPVRLSLFIYMYMYIFIHLFLFFIYSHPNIYLDFFETRKNRLLYNTNLNLLHNTNLV